MLSGRKITRHGFHGFSPANPCRSIYTCLIAARSAIIAAAMPSSSGGTNHCGLCAAFEKRNRTGWTTRIGLSNRRPLTLGRWHAIRARSGWNGLLTRGAVGRVHIGSGDRAYNRARPSQCDAGVRTSAGVARRDARQLRGARLRSDRATGDRARAALRPRCGFCLQYPRGRYFVAELRFDVRVAASDDRSATRTAEQAITLQPDRISVFGYAHLPNWRKNQRLIDAAALPDANARYRQSEAIADTFISAGYVAIGIDHFALPEDSLAIAVAEGRLRRNFQGYTDDPCEVLIGFGSSAISHLRDGYVQNLADNRAYARAVASGELASARGHRFSDEDRRRGDIIGELMCRHEVNLDSYGGGDGFYDEITRLEPLRTDGFLDIDGARIQLTPQGRPFVRLVAAAFDEYLPAHQTGFSVAV